MKQSISALLLGVVYALSLPASAQLEDEPVRMDKAPFHVPAFSNGYVTVMRVNIPPGRHTGFHTHFADSVSVNLMPAIRTTQMYESTDIGEPTVGDPNPGWIAFNNVTEEGPYTHKVTNVGPTPFFNISVLLKDRNVTGPSVSNRSGSAGFVRILDNERLRAWRVILEPGEATGQITQTAPGLRVYVRGGVLDEIVPGAAPRGMAPNAGEFIWQDAGQTRTVENTGSTVLEFVEFELK